MSPPVASTSAPRVALVAPTPAGGRVATAGGSGRVSNDWLGVAHESPALLVARAVKK